VRRDVRVSLDDACTRACMHAYMHDHVATATRSWHAHHCAPNTLQHRRNYAYTHSWPNKKLVKVLAKITPEAISRNPLSHTPLLPHTLPNPSLLPLLLHNDCIVRSKLQSRK